MERIRIATYNIWNSPDRWSQRLAAMVDDLDALAADVVALQEAPCEAAPGRSLAAYLEAATAYRHVLHLPYDDDGDDGDRPEGLALLSRFPLREHWTNWGHGTPAHNNSAARVHVEIAGALVGITNVHLDWLDPAGRVRAIAAIVDDLVDRRPADIEILCGDFNEHDDGPVAARLEASWRDAVSALGTGDAPVTLDFEHNPRWAGCAVDERSGRFDRIYLRERGGSAVTVAAAGLFGRDPANRLGIVPSDHYGVFVDLALGPALRTR
ncbi:MAG TPA: endonuclease/exonuclease/phosphatase family protein [Kofleriaceae bacterium]|nr:endonuclease/exonuclease/phosphatase family protein [Kofleriaceae bacterium]